MSSKGSRRSLTRLLDPDSILKTKIIDFVSRGDFGLASGRKPSGSYDRVWFEELVAADEITFDSGVFLLRKDSAKAFKLGVQPEPMVGPSPQPSPVPITALEPGLASGEQLVTDASTKTLRIFGTVPPEIWNRLGTKILPKLRSGSDLRVGLEFSVNIKTDTAQNLTSELRQILQELGLSDSVRIE
jgi:hypothetical protein